MTTHKEWLDDRASFLRLVGIRDPQGDVPVAIRLDLTREQAELMAPGVEDFDQLRFRCAEWVRNFLANEVDRMERHLEFLAKAR